MKRYYSINVLFLIVIGSFLLMPYFGIAKLIALLLALLIYLVILIWASYDINSQFYLQTICSNKSKHKMIALTFDDGPDASKTPEILDLLKEFHAKASFFIIGSKAEQQEFLCKRILLEGHQLANHSFSHSNIFPIMRVSRIQNEVEKCQLVLKKISGETNLYFRPPYGVSNPFVARALKPFNFIVIGWSIRSFDTCTEDQNKLYNRIVSNIKDGDIILLHDTSKHVVNVLREVLVFLKENNYQAVTVEDLVRNI